MLARTIAILFILSTTLLSCTKDESMTNNGYNPGLMSADIGGSLWYANSGNAVSQTATALDLYAAYNNQSHISIVLGGYTGTGGYSLGGFNSAIYYDGNGIEYPATNGYISITSDNGTQVMGTFYFSGTSITGGYPVSITNGQFNLSR